MAKMDTAMIQAEGLRKEYPTKGQPLLILDGIDFSLQAGQSLAIMGPSGSGKSTLLHILGALEKPSGGRLRLAGREPFALSANDLADFRNRHIGFVFQDHQLLPQCSALENVLVPTLARRGDRRAEGSKAEALLERVGLAQRLDYPPSDLSGGERQRVAIARALINSPQILLCDEPTGNLDHAAAQSVGDCFLEIQQDAQAALVVVTHNPDFARRFQRVLHLIDGRLSE